MRDNIAHEIDDGKRAEAQPEINAPLLVITVDIFGVIKRVNNEAKDLMNVESLTLINQTIQSLLVESEREVFTSLLNESIHTQQQRTAIFHFRDKNSDYTAYHCNLISLQSNIEKEVVVYALPLIQPRDETINENTQHEGYASPSTKLDLLSKVARVSITGITICDSKKKVLWVNSAFEKITGYCLEEIKQRSLGTFLQGKNTDKNVVNSIRSRLNKGKNVDTEILNYSKNGVEYWCHLLISPVIEQGSITHFIGIQHDITQQRKQHEIIARRSRMHAVAKLASKICHDINNIMAIISGNSQLLSMQKKDDKSQKYIENIDVATQRASTVTQSLLRIVKSEQLEKQLVNINRVINDVIASVQHRFSASMSYNTDLRYRGDIAINQSLLFDALLSLLHRAISALESSGQVSIETLPVSTFMPTNGIVVQRPIAAARYAYICIEDSGSGIEEATLKAYFAPMGSNQLPKPDALDFTLLSDFCTCSKSGLEVTSDLLKGTTVKIWIPESR